MSFEYNEENLIEQATVDILANIGWDIKTAWHNETFGKDGLLGRDNKSEVILFKFLIPALKDLNPDLPKQAYESACLQIAQKEAGKTLGRTNKEKNELIKDGVKVSFTDNEGELVRKKLKVFDFNTPENNHF